MIVKIAVTFLFKKVRKSKSNIFCHVFSSKEKLYVFFSYAEGNPWALSFAWIRRFFYDKEAKALKNRIGSIA